MSRRDYVFLLGILALGWGFWLHRIGVNDHDDMLSNELMFVRQSVQVVAFHNPWPDQSPLYFLVLWAARKINESPFFIQFLNALCLSSTLTATYVLAAAFSRSRAVARAAVFLGAISPTSLWLVRSGRMYSIQVLLSVLAALFVLRYLDRRRRRDLAVFAILCVLNVYNHFVGFLITAILFLPLIADAAIEVGRRLRTDRSTQAWRPLIVCGVAGLGILILVVPQLVRFESLVSGGIPFRADVSLPGLSTRFLDRVAFFWFVNADWGTVRRADRVVTAIYFGSIGVLAIAGLAAARRRGVIAALWIVVPVLAVGLAAARMDVRDRYFVWTLPLIWIAIAAGGFGDLPSARLPPFAEDVARGLRAALVLAVSVASLWLLWNKLPERYPEWSKVMAGVSRVYRPSMVVYMPPGSPMGIPALIASQIGADRGLQTIRVLGPETRAEFVKEVERGQEFVFLVHAQNSNDELVQRSRYLEGGGYRKTVVPAAGAHAEIFTRSDVDGFSRPQRLPRAFSADSIVAWARQELRARPRKPARAPVLADAVVGRVFGDGSVREGRMFIDQRGEDGSWRLGPLEWDAVEEVRATSGSVDADMIAAHPSQQSVLVVAFAALEMRRSLKLFYGIADSGLFFRNGAPVDVYVYIDDALALSTICSNTAGWKTLAADTTGIAGKAADVVMLITTQDDRSRHFAFRVEPSSQPALPVMASAPRDTGPVVLTHGGTLKDAVDRLQVYRIEGDRRTAAQPDTRTYSAEDMHEAAGTAGEGTLRRHWALGPLLWDAVGVTRQTSGGDSRDGVWAHPKNGTTLVIEAPAVKTGDLLRGFAGLTDYAVAQAGGQKIDTPVRFTVALDGRVVFERNAARARGWTAWAVPAGADRDHSLRIEISSATDSWAHFVFDVWSQ